MSDQPTPPAITRETLLSHLHLLKVEDVTQLLRPELVLLGNVTSSAFYRVRVGGRMYNFQRQGKEHVFPCADLAEMELLQKELHKQRTTPANVRLRVVLPDDPETVAVLPAPVTAPAEPQPVDPAILLDQEKAVRRNALSRMSEDYLRRKGAEMNIVGLPTHGQKDALVELILEAEYSGETVVEPEPAPEPVPPAEASVANEAAEVATLPLDDLRKMAGERGLENADKASRREILKFLKG